MSLTELKSQIITKVNAIQDEMLLEDIYGLLKTDIEPNTTYILSDNERRALEQGLDDSEKGKVFSSEKANELIREWLKK